MTERFIRKPYQDCNEESLLILVVKEYIISITLNDSDNVFRVSHVQVFA